METKRWKGLEAACQRRDWGKHGSDIPRFKGTVKSREQSHRHIYGGEDKKTGLNCGEGDAGWAWREKKGWQGH